MNKLSFLTARMLARKLLNDFSFNETAEWALEMLLAGHETPSLLILAGLSKPVDSFEAENYLRASLKELYIDIPSDEQALFQYADMIATEMAAGKNVRGNLEQLFRMIRPFDHSPGKLHDFYLLYWAWDNLDDHQEQFYWNGATLENIERITIEVAREWLKGSRSMATQE